MQPVQLPRRSTRPSVLRAFAPAVLELGGARRCRARLGLVSLVLPVALLAACDPCSGVVAFRTATPEAAVLGQLVHVATGAAVDGVRITVRRVGGVALERDSLSTTTAGGGHWSIRVAATEPGEVVFDVEVAPPPPLAPYHVRNVRVATSDRPGDGTVLEPWVVAPWFPIHAEFALRGTADQRLPGLAVSFTRTGGPTVTGPGWSGDVFRGVTDAGGRLPLFNFSVSAGGLSEVVGDLAIELGGELGTSVTRGVRLAPTHLYRGAIQIKRLGGGPSLAYGSQVYHRATGRPLPQVQATFRRTGGVRTEPEVVSTTSDADGYVRFPLRALGVGTVVGDVTLTPPGFDRPVTLTGVMIATFDSDTGRALANWTVGAYLNYYGIVVANGSPATGTRVTVRRTGGIPVTPSEYSFTIGSSDQFPITGIPGGLGTAVFDIEFRPPAPFRAFIVRNLQVSTLEDDHPFGVGVWTWSVDGPPTGPPGTTVSFL